MSVTIVRERKQQTLSFAAARKAGKNSGLRFDPLEVSASIDLHGLNAELEHMRPQLERMQQDAKHMAEEIRRQVNPDEIRKSIQEQLHALQQEWEEI